MNAVIALPILLDNKLINGYAIEINIPEIQLNLSNKSINLILRIIKDNSKFMISEPKVIAAPIKQELIPLDLLITSVNIEINLYLINESGLTPLIWLHLVQPHVMLQLHEKTQCFHCQIYDFNIKRSTPSSNQNDLSKIPLKTDYIIPVLETRQGEQNKKTGIKSTFLSLKIKDFLCDSNQQIDFNPMICVCNSCFRCYELNDLKLEDSNKIQIDFLIERPVRLQTNLVLIQQMNHFLQSLDLEPQPDTDPMEQIKYLMNSNAKFNSKQIVLVIDLPTSNEPQSLFISLNCISLNLLKKNNEISCFDLVLSDLQSKFQLSCFKLDYIPIIGPLTVKINSNFNSISNELFILFNIPSINICFNKQLLNFIQNCNFIGTTKADEANRLL